MVDQNKSASRIGSNVGRLAGSPIGTADVVRRDALLLRGVRLLRVRQGLSHGRVISVVVAAVAAFVLGAPPAWSHNGGKAVPVVLTRVEESGPLQALVDVTVRDEDGGEPVRGAVVRGAAKMTRPHTMYTYFGPLPEVSPGRYRANVKLPMTATWVLQISVGGSDVVPRTVRQTVVIDRSALTEQSAGRSAVPTAGPADVALVGVVRYEITRRELQDIVVLWVHGIAAMFWIGGLALLLLALTAGAGSFAPDARDRIGRWYRRRGLPATWAAAVVVVVTGVYNMLRVSPFALAWRPADISELKAIPYGLAYEAILTAKLMLFVVMIAAGFAAVLRARDRRDAPGKEGGSIALGVRSLGVSGIVFLACAPAILAAVAALRYVHILSHVAEVSGP